MQEVRRLGGIKLGASDRRARRAATSKLPTGKKSTGANFVPGPQETARRSTESMSAGPSLSVASGVTPTIDL
jgi:hypothetical protein